MIIFLKPLPPTVILGNLLPPIWIALSHRTPATLWALVLEERDMGPWMKT